MGIPGLAEQYLDYYKGIYSGISVGESMRAEDDKSSNTILTTENYLVEGLEGRGKLFENLQIRGDSVRGQLADDVKSGRKWPVSLPFPFYREHQVIMGNLDSHYTQLDPISIVEPYLRFTLASVSVANAFSVTWQLKTGRDHVLPEEVEAFQSDVDKIQAATVWYYDVRPSAARQGIESAAETPKKDALVISILIAALGLAVSGCWWGLKADADYRQDAQYFPVSAFKITIMSIATLGLYPIFWLLKHWIWSRDNLNKRRRPFLRAVFWPLFIPSAFTEMNAGAPEAMRVSRPAVIGVTALGIGAFYSSLLANLYIDGPAEMYPKYAVAEAAAFLLQLVAVLVVANFVAKLNISDEHVIRKNSVFNNFNKAGILLFPMVFYVCYLV